MADPSKKIFAGGGGGGSLVSDLKSLFSITRTRRTMVFAYGFMFTVIAFTAFIAFSPSSNSSSPWFNNIFSSSIASDEGGNNSPNGSHFSSFFSHFFPNSSQPTNPNTVRSSEPPKQAPQVNQTVTASPSQKPQLNQTVNGSSASKNETVKGGAEQNRGGNYTSSEAPKQAPPLNQTVTKPPSQQPQLNQTVNGSSASKNETVKGGAEQNRAGNSTSLLKQSNNSTSKGENLKNSKVGIGKSLLHCNIFDGNWVKDDSYPLYPPGSCPHIDESFNCFVNGRPDANFQKYRWQPKDCNIPRLNGKDMLELLRGKRLVFVGDSLNRNMWESLLCILRNSVSDTSKMYEVSGRREFRTDHSYLFVIKDYNCTVEFFVSPFLVQEWELPETNGSKKETLRLDVVEPSSAKYKNADYIVFNTGHWWTHPKTSKGKNYYQEGSHVYGELNVVEAFRKALTTWARWVDANINPKKSMVLFRGYSSSHFRGGQWNSGGQCNDETEPIKNQTYLSQYPPKMRVLEKVLKNMKTPVTYLNITRMTDYRKDGHPSVYRKQNLSEEERKSPLRFQDCSHWCLPGVPDSWNELLYAELLVHQYKQQQQNEQQQQQQQQKQKQKQRP